MGSGGTKKQNNVQLRNNLFNKLSLYLEQLKSQSDLLSSAKFSTVDEMNALESKKTIDLLQNQINTELINVRKEVKNMKNSSSFMQHEYKLNELNTQTQQLYLQISHIIKEKIKPSA